MKFKYGTERVCPNGHKTISSLEYYCTKCGVKLPEFSHCLKGHEVYGDDKFCGICGEQVLENKKE